LTYKVLLDEQTHNVETGAVAAQTAANRATALRGFMAANGLQTDDVVGSELRGGFPQAMETFSLHLERLERSQRSISNTRAALKPWRDAVVRYDTLQAIAADKSSPFVEQLRELVGTQHVTKVARLAGVSVDMLRGWLMGKKPRRSSDKSIRRVESLYALQPGALLMLAGIKPRGCEQSPLEESHRSLNTGMYLAN
jgi:hypothetical protein